MVFGLNTIQLFLENGITVFGFTTKMVFGENCKKARQTKQSVAFPGQAHITVENEIFTGPWWLLHSIAKHFKLRQR